MSTIIKAPTTSDLWRTPQYIYIGLQRLLRVQFEWDLAASANNTLCNNWYDEEQNSLVYSWSGKYAFCNPPYGKKGPGEWVEKAHQTSALSQQPGVIAILIKAATETEWWHRYAMSANKVILIKGRVNFIPPVGYVPPIDSETGKHRFTGNNHASAVLVYDNFPTGCPQFISWAPEHKREYKLEDYVVCA